MGDVGSVLAIGFVMSFAPITRAISVVLKSLFMSFSSKIELSFISASARMMFR